MMLKTGMVFSSIKAPCTYNEIVRLYFENGKKMVEVSQFSKENDDLTIIFSEKEIKYMLKKGTAYIVNNWTSRN